MTISSPASTDWLDRDVSHAAGAKRRVVMNPSRLASGSVPNMTSRLQMQHGPAGASVFGQRLNPPCLCLKKMRCHVFAADPLRRDMRAAPVIDMQVDPKRAEAGNLERMRARRLHVQSLSERDIGKVAMFLRVGRERLRCEWEIVFGGDLDVLMLGGDEPDTVVGAIDGPVATLRVVDGGAGACAAVGVLTRPLQYEAFVDALSALEIGVLGDPHSGTRPVARPVAAAAPSGVKFRLRRWPPTALLQGHRYHVRLASCMSAQHIGVDELVRLSNVSRPACEEFLATLIAQNMLDLKSADAAPPMSAATAIRPVDPVAVRSLPDTGLLAKIRRGLGLALLR